MTAAIARPAVDPHREGLARHERGDLHGALECYERALALRADDPDVLCDVARAARDLGELVAAETLLRTVLDRHSAHVQAVNSLAIVLRMQGRIDDAIAILRPALDQWPQDARLHCTLGSIYQANGDIEALHCYEEALRYAPELGEAHANLALLHAQCHAYDAALAAAQRAVRLLPGNPEARFNLATIRLSLGDFAAAWPDYEARFANPNKLHGAVRRPFDLPVWEGGTLGRTPLLIWGEQGVGEEILFAALVPEAAARSTKVIVECDKRLVPLFRRSFPGIDAVPRETPPHLHMRLHPHAQQSAMGSLCRYLRRDIGDFAGHAGYLRPDPARVAETRRRYLQDGDECLVGIAWRTRDQRNGRYRTTTLADWLPILRTAGVKFVNLQYGDTTAERAALYNERGLSIHHDDTIDPLVDLDAQAAQIAAMDAVVTVQNATMYLANAVGAKVYGLLPHYRDWRWPIHHATSPWLPGVRPFAQELAGEWGSATERLANALAEDFGQRASP